MWFAALSDYRTNPWFVGFAERLLEGSPEVFALLDKNPFPDHPPRYVRAVTYDYRFSSWEERRENWGMVASRAARSVSSNGWIA